MGSSGAEGGVDTSAVIGGAGPATGSPTNAAVVPGGALLRLGGAGVAVARGDSVGGDDTGRTSSPGSDDAAGDDNPVRSLRRLGVGAALDQGFALFRFRFRRLVGLAACLVIPVQLLDLVLRLTASAPTTTEAQSSAAPSLLFFGGSSDWAVFTVALQAVALSILGICVGYLVSRLLEGEDVGFRTLVGVGARRSWIGLLIVPLAFLFRLPFLLIPVVGFVIGDAFVFVASIVAGAEGLRPIAALGRNLRLTRRAFGPALVMALGSLCITQVVRISLYAGPVTLVAMFSPPEGLLVVISQLASLLQLVLQPLTACLAASGYLLLRARVEGIDLDHRRAERERERARPEVSGASS